MRITHEPVYVCKKKNNRMMKDFNFMDILGSDDKAVRIFSPFTFALVSGTNVDKLL